MNSVFAVFIENGDNSNQAVYDSNMKLLFYIMVLSLWGFSYGKNENAKQRSLVFVFDGSQSMGPFLTFFKKGSNMILDNLSRISNSPIANYILVPYADPGELFGRCVV